MQINGVFVLFIVNILCVSAKISRGPRGRFDKLKRNNQHVHAHHAHYSYHPPSYISFTCRYCTSPSSYPVYHGLPPTYVYKYRESGNAVGDLLTGLALYNLGKSMAEQWHYSHYYVPHHDEKCSMQVIDRAYFQETTFPCFMMSSFINHTAEMRYIDSESHMVDITSSHVDMKSFLHNNGTPIKITRSQDCLLWHNLSFVTERKHVPCALLMVYAETMKPAGVPVYIWLPALLATVISVSVCCKCCNVCKTRKAYITEVPINPTTIVSYHSDIH